VLEKTRHDGQLTASRRIRIDGTVEGVIGRDTKNGIVGKQGRVSAEIHAAIAAVDGRVDGDIYGEKLVELKVGAVVQGIDRGASFNGTVTMV
jgi:cytoskeletal protein CcmA (bactofilin family)